MMILALINDHNVLFITQSHRVTELCEHDCLCITGSIEQQSLYDIPYFNSIFANVLFKNRNEIIVFMPISALL